MNRMTFVGIVTLCAGAVNLLLPSRILAQPSTQPTVDFKIETDLRAGDRSLAALVYFIDQKAIVFDDDEKGTVSVIFDLDSQSWRDSASAKRVTLEDAKQWAAESRKRSLASAAAIKDEGRRKFLEALLDPNLHFREENSKLIAENDAISFTITPRVTIEEEWFDRLVDYDRLNAYHKAMTERKLPPDTQLALTSELVRRRMWPDAIDITVTTPAGKTQLHATIKMSALTELERAVGLKALTRSTTQPATVETEKTKVNDRSK